MKEKIVIFIVGLLLGSVISTGSIYIYSITNNSNNNNAMQMPNNNQMGGNGQTPPEMPNNGQNSTQS